MPLPKMTTGRKMVEEAEELVEALVHYNNACSPAEQEIAARKVEDEIADVVIVATRIAYLINTSPEECIQRKTLADAGRGYKHGEPVEDPTHGKIDPEIRERVEEMQPGSVAQQVAIENTLQRRRTEAQEPPGAHPSDDPRQWRHARWFEPHTAVPAAVDWSESQGRWLAMCAQDAGPTVCHEVLLLREEFKPEEERKRRKGW